jgi:hypothetical protein
LLDYDVGKFTSGEIQLKKNLSAWINASGSLQLKQVLEKDLDLVQGDVLKMQAFLKKTNLPHLA